MKVSEFDYDLPPELIAQEPLPKREKSRLLVLNRKEKSICEIVFSNIAGLFNPGDVLVLNNTKVLPARLYSRRKTGAKIELLLLEKRQPGLWESLVKPSKKIKIGEMLYFDDSDFTVQIAEKYTNGKWLLKFSPADAVKLMYKQGVMPTPPYIKKKLDKSSKYQTIYAEKEGAIAAPTAGLHFTESLISGLRNKGVDVVFIALHVGLGTFKPVKSEIIEEHNMENERFEVGEDTAKVINAAKRTKRRIFACGTSVVRALETQAYINDNKQVCVQPGCGRTGLFIMPGYNFKIIDCLITNFHLPESTNLILVSAFAGHDFICRAYSQAIEKRFRFYSFGDAMLIL